MNFKRNLLSLKAATEDDFISLKYLIDSFNLKPKDSWREWENNLKDKILIVDDGNKIKIQFEFNELNDLLQFSPVKNIVEDSNLIIAAKKQEKIKVWCQGKDNFIRFLQYDEEWKARHLFSENSNLIISIIKMFLGMNDKVRGNHKIEELIVITYPFEDFKEYKFNNSFDKLWKELEK